MFESLKNAVKKTFEGVIKGASESFNFLDKKLEKSKLYFEKKKAKEKIKTSSKLKLLGLDIGLGASTVFNWPIKLAKKAFNGLRNLLGIEKSEEEEEELLADEKIEYGNLKPGPVVRKIVKKLSKEQIENAIIIENVFRQAGMPDKIIAAAIVNAHGESGLKAYAAGDRGHSIGLFQLHSRGAGKGLSVEYRKDPVNNTVTILKREVLTKRGNALIQAEKDGESVAELAAIFSRDIERPRDTIGAMQRRRVTARRLFGSYAD